MSAAQKLATKATWDVMVFAGSASGTGVMSVPGSRLIHGNAAMGRSSAPDLASAFGRWDYELSICTMDLSMMHNEIYSKKH